MSWLKQLFSRRGEYDALSEEIQAHLDEKVEELVAGGMARTDANHAARREFGNPALTEEDGREVWRWASVEDFFADIRHGWRSLRRNPVFTVVGLLTIAIGIGANAAVFTVVNSVLLKPLNYPHSEQLVSLHQVAPGAAGLADFENGLLLSASMYFSYAEHNRAFQAMGVWDSGVANVTGLAEPEQVRGVGVSDGLLQALAVPPEVGRWFTAEDQDPHGPERVILSDGYWRRHFGADRSVIGRNLMIDAHSREIVGVMPPGFRVGNEDFDVIAPLAFDRSKLILAGFGLHGIARLKPGVTIAQANADLTRMLPIWMESWSNGPGSDPHWYDRWQITPLLRPLKQEVVGNVSDVLWVVMGTHGPGLADRLRQRDQFAAGAGGGAAAGAGGSRGAGRRVGTNRARAAGRKYDAGVLGGALGAVLAWAGVRFLVAIGPANLPRLQEISLDSRTLVFTLILSVISGLLFGLIPALKYAGPKTSLELRSAGRNASVSKERHRARNLLVVGQVAMALVLLVSAGLMIRTFHALRTVEPGFTDAAHLQLMRINIPETLIAQPEMVTRTQNAILDKLAAIPGVKSAAFVSAMPMEGFESGWDGIYAEDKNYADSESVPMRFFKYGSPGFLQTAGTRMVAGRDITWDDIYAQRPVVMISENLAREMWGEPAAAIGKRVRKYRQPAVARSRRSGAGRPRERRAGAGAGNRCTGRRMRRIFLVLVR